MLRIVKNQPIKSYYIGADGQIIVASNEKKNVSGVVKIECTLIYGSVWKFKIFRLMRNHIVVLFNLVICIKKIACKAILVDKSWESA